jgi:DNA-binding transcriptional LysR family regulator
MGIPAISPEYAAVELRHLRYFVAVAETGSLSRAAEKLFIAQPPLSVQIRQLEEEIGGELFIRHPKGVKLTPAGLALLPEARHLLERAARLPALVRDTGPVGSLTLGIIPSAASTVLPPLVRHLRQHHPNLELDVRELITSEQVEALVAGQIDAGLARTPARHPGVVVACALPDPFCMALPEEDPSARSPVVDLRDFAQHAFVAFTRHRGPAYFDQSIRLCSLAGFSPRIRCEASTVHGVLERVAAGLGVALVPASSALLHVRAVVLRPLRRSRRDDMLALIRRAKDSHPLKDELAQACGGIFESMRGEVERTMAAGAARKQASRVR